MSDGGDVSSARQRQFSALGGENRLPEPKIQ